jgi:hypothetical protein
MEGYRRYCVQCGSELKQGARFCANCGQAVAAKSPQPAVIGEHDAATRDLQAPPPSPAWGVSAVPPDGALFPPPGSGFPSQDAPFPTEGSRFPAEGSRFPAEGSRFPREGSRFPREGSRFPTEGSRLPTEASRFPTEGSRLPTEASRFPTEGSRFPTEASRFPVDGSRPPSEGNGFPPSRPAATREIPGLPPGRPAGTRDVPDFPPGGPSGPPDSFGFPRQDAFPPPRSSGFPPEGVPSPLEGAAAAGAPFPRDDTAAMQADPGAPSKRLASPTAHPAAVSALPAAGPPAAAGSAHPAPTGTDTAQFTPDWVNDVGFSPQWEPSHPSAPPGDAGPPAGDRDHSRRLLVVGLIALVAAVIVVPALLIAHSFHGITSGGAAAAQPTAKHPTRGATAPAPSRRTAAAGVATLLAQTATDRSSIVNAVGAVEHCTAALGQAPQVFQQAAASRQRLLRQLASLPGRSALPAPMLQELTGAWQASAAVDTDLGKWAQDEVTGGCKPNDHADANFQASGAPDVQATNDKTAFVSRWNSIAAKYGLTRYRTSQL